MLYLFITGNRSAYMNNIFSVMSLPQGWSYELKYKEKGGIIDEESKKLSENSSEEVLILFVREEDDVYIPLRMGRLVGIVKDEGQMYYSVRLGQYCNWNGKSEFCEWLHRLLGNDIRHLTYETKDSADGKLVIRSNQKPINELEKKEDSWIKTVRELGKEDLFKKYYSVFTKVEIDGKVDFGENGKKAFVRSGQNYIARITYYIPDFNNSPMDTLPIEFKGTNTSLKLVKNTDTLLSEQNKIEIPFSIVGKVVEKKTALLSYGMKKETINGKNVRYAQTPIEINIRGWMNKWLYLILVAVFVLLLTGSTYVNANLEDMGENIRAALSVGASIVTSVSTLALIKLTGKPKV